MLVEGPPVEDLQTIKAASRQPVWFQPVEIHEAEQR
jgi:hypothetical protein